MQALLLDHNRLASLPEAVLRLPRLEVLNASGNALTYVPDGISQLTLLSQLRLNGNQLVAMPTSLGRCIALAELDVSSNRLQVSSFIHLAGDDVRGPLRPWQMLIWSSQEALPALPQLAVNNS